MNNLLSVFTLLLFVISLNSCTNTNKVESIEGTYKYVSSQDKQYDNRDSYMKIRESENKEEVFIEIIYNKPERASLDLTFKRIDENTLAYIVYEEILYKIVIEGKHAYYTVNNHFEDGSSNTITLKKVKS